MVLLTENWMLKISSFFPCYYYPNVPKKMLVILAPAYRQTGKRESMQIAF